ncbi:hypothetical protein ACIRS1_00700 [Kitasatospora sp. NPDC101176]|uniref:hypothetical protein n=1 Tax=Kitasatospora sp. NPDC101176 TaxID=3364099 RepID=UPI0038257DA2
MAVIAVAGGPGAPGATTTALALLLAWPLEPGRRVLLVEADPDGGAVLAGALEGRVEAVYGLRNLAVADRRGLLAQTIWEQLIDLSPDGTAERLLLPGLTDPTQAPGLAYTWEPLIELLHGLEPQGYDVILDLGRSGATGTSAVLARRADVVAVTVRTTLRGLSSARPRLSALTEDLATAGTGSDALGLLLVGEGPYSGAEVSREFGLPVLGLLPHAVRTARVLSDGGDTTDRRFIRSELMRTARSAADEVQLLVRRRRQRLAPNPAPASAPVPVPALPTAPDRAQPQGPGPSVPGPVAAPAPAAYRPTVGSPAVPAEAVPAQAYESAARGGTPPAPAAYGGTGSGDASSGPPTYGQVAYGEVPYGEATYGEVAYGPVTQGPTAYGPVGPGPVAYGPVAGEQPSYQPPQPVPPVITTGPVAPLAGLAPQPAAPAPFPAHVQAPYPAQQAHQPYGRHGRHGPYGPQEPQHPQDLQEPQHPQDPRDPVNASGRAGQADPQDPHGHPAAARDEQQYRLQQPAGTPDQQSADGRRPQTPGEVLRAR